MGSARFFFFLLFVSFTLSFSFTSAFRDRCHPEDAQILSEVFNRPILDCCKLMDTGCNPNTSWVDYLTIKNDAISGRLSPAIGKMTRLHTLILVRLPNVYGELPIEMAKLTNLRMLVIKNTNLTGPIPTWLGQLKNLESLDVSHSRFTGSIPQSLASLPKLTWLSLEWNQLTGSIPESFGRLPLQGLTLSHNRLSGPVPKNLGYPNFDYIDLNRNRLVGDPSHLFNNRDKPLRRLDLSRNLFDFDLSKVTQLDLYNFNVSYNRLCGRIPQGGALQSFPSESFAHNECLCGPPLSTAC
ncbi:unnamed protein product [Victoria cruziana]